MNTRTIAPFVAALCMTGCAAFPGSSALPSPGSLAPSTRIASQGSVFFVSSTEGWELTQPPDQQRTVILQTVDGGSRWKIWGIAPGPGSPVAFSATEVVLSTGTQLLRSSDGSSWTVRAMPTFGQPTFLPDLQHGWLGGFPIYVPPAPASTPPPGKGGGGSTTGKGGGGSTTGKGGTTGPASTCQGKGCAPISLWSTADGGASWRHLWDSTATVSGGPMYFFSPAVGLIEQGTNLLVTRDGGATWRAQPLSIPGITADQPANMLAPTMFDARTGVLPLQASSGLYLSRTTDGGLDWSAPERVNECAGCTGLELTLFDQTHWIDYSQGVHLTSDGGQTWKAATTTNPVKTASAVEVVSAPSAVFVLSPGLFASETTDWGAHWRAVALPDIYPTYRGFGGLGGWTGP